MADKEMTYVRVYVPLTQFEAEALIALAKRQRRHPRDQAAFMLSEALAKYIDGTPQESEMKEKKEK